MTYWTSLHIIKIDPSGYMVICFSNLLQQLRLADSVFLPSILCNIAGNTAADVIYGWKLFQMFNIVLNWTSIFPFSPYMDKWKCGYSTTEWVTCECKIPALLSPFCCPELGCNSTVDVKDSSKSYIYHENFLPKLKSLNTPCFTRHPAMWKDPSISFLQKKGLIQALPWPLLPHWNYLPASKMDPPVYIQHKS